jgi:hypothetical protein
MYFKMIILNSICDRVVKVVRSGRIGAIRKGSNPFKCIIFIFLLLYYPFYYIIIYIFYFFYNFFILFFIFFFLSFKIVKNKDF